MIITETKRSRQTTFIMLESGDVFKTCKAISVGGNIPWMKMDDVRDDNNKYNAVSLDDGTPGFFKDDEAVIHLKYAELKTNEEV